MFRDFCDGRCSRRRSVVNPRLFDSPAHWDAGGVSFQRMKKEAEKKCFFPALLMCFLRRCDERC